MKKKSNNTNNNLSQLSKSQSSTFIPLAQLLLEAYDRIEEKMRLIDKKKERPND